jgi:HAD superfamily hydrolase (TIGR01509 family)
MRWATRVSGSHSAVIFDMDGLLVDSEPLYMRAWQQAASELGFALTDEFYHSLLGLPEPESESAVLDAFGSEFRMCDFRTRWKQLWIDMVEAGELQPKTGALELLRALEADRIPLAVATSSSRDYATLSLERTGLRHFFLHTVVAEDVLQGKPAPDIFFHAASRLGVAPSQCLVLEDSSTGAEAGLSAGMSVILVPDLIEPPDECASRVLMVATSLREAGPHVLRAVRAA